MLVLVIRDAPVTHHMPRFLSLNASFKMLSIYDGTRFHMTNICEKNFVQIVLLMVPPDPSWMLILKRVISLPIFFYSPLQALINNLAI